MLGWFKQNINPNEKQESRKRYRYIPAEIVTEEIEDENNYMKVYNDLKDAYDTDFLQCCAEKKTWLKTATRSDIFKCTVSPNKPSDPGAYTGYYAILDSIPEPYPA